MSVFKRSKIYWYKFMFKGELVQESSHCKNAKDAADMEAAHRTALAKGEVGIRDKKAVPTLAAFLRDRIEAKINTGEDDNNTGQRRRSYRWMRPAIDPLSSHALGKLRLDVITSEDVDGYIASRNEAELAVGTINRELRVLRRVLRLAVEWNVMSVAPKVRMAGPEPKRERIVTDVEFDAYLKHATPMLGSLAIVLMDTGMRPDEAHRLAWENVDFVNGKRGLIRINFGKTTAARRVLPMTSRVRRVLQEMWETVDRPQSGWLWPAPTKTGHIDHSSVKKQHIATLKDSGVRRFVLYSLRHTFATKLGLTGIDAWSLCRIMGWSNVASAAPYIHPNDAHIHGLLDTVRSKGSYNFRYSRPQPKLPCEDKRGKLLKVG